MSDLLDDIVEKVREKNPIPQTAGANIKVDNVEDLAVDEFELMVSFDTTEKDVLELLEKYEKLDIVFPPEVFLELTPETVKRLSHQGMQNYFLAKSEAEASERIAKKKELDPTYGQVRFDGGDIGSRLELTPEEKAATRGKHVAILNDYEVKAAEKFGYRKVRDSDPITNVNPETGKKETLIKMEVSEERHRSHMEDVSVKSKKRVRNRKINAKNSTLELRRDTVGTEINR